ncbi:16S rRNA (guanine(527)-N(7))-methyltransferase RsmG [Acetanaerobacterium elongatum]|uniref:Ribosomal RNA small subunit methyltransferase G n=1 Tax=Acetanaerobacterium elongatum TaxID=258515 RepID=A0A1H0DED5_9FIRM|nr:16S rRNA (guanine(527)-N(7))-methyltransferase RsmG [Acetanaerobacterium elongatum]SDN68533.1 16S rRNA m(7)G-527 methyltransferase [Acetanaerobacterium elongatum]
MSLTTDTLKNAAPHYGIALTEQQLARFDLYKDLLLDWSTRMNLTAIKDEEGIAVKHFLDSILLDAKLHLSENARLIDVGTGAGFPAVPVKIMRPDIFITLADGLNKRITFLKELTAQLGLESEAIHTRAEDLGKNPAYRERYDYATARAVASLNELCEYCLPFVKPGGIFAAMKSGEVDEELKQAQNAVKLLGGQVQEVIRFGLPDESKRSIVVIKKISHTLPKYPRPGAQIAKKPL